MKDVARRKRLVEMLDERLVSVLQPIKSLDDAADVRPQLGDDDVVPLKLGLSSQSTPIDAP